MPPFFDVSYQWMEYSACLSFAVLFLWESSFCLEIEIKIENLR